MSTIKSKPEPKVIPEERKFSTLRALSNLLQNNPNADKLSNFWGLKYSRFTIEMENELKVLFNRNKAICAKFDFELNPDNSVIDLLKETLKKGENEDIELFEIRKEEFNAKRAKDLEEANKEILPAMESEISKDFKYVQLSENDFLALCQSKETKRINEKGVSEIINNFFYTSNQRTFLMKLICEPEKKQK